MGDGSGLILGVSGLRGVVGETLTTEVAVRFASAFAAWARGRHGAGTIAVARDGRGGGEAMYHAAIAGVLGGGHAVRALDVAATPTAGIAADGDAIGAIMVTASHNPSEWNGLKCLVYDDALGTGRAPSAGEAREIVALFERGGGGTLASDALGTVEDVGGVEPTVEHAALAARRIGDLMGLDDVSGLARGRRVVLDSVNASGALGAGVLVRGLGAHEVQLAGDGSGVFPHTPEPTAENLSGEGGLCGAVPGLGADVGFAQDPDADRLAIVDERGRYIGEEYTLALCALAVLGGRDRAGGKGPATGSEPVLVVNLSTSRMIDDVAAHLGAEVVRSAVGEAHVVETMKRLAGEGREVVLGGEGNGGVIWPEVSFVRDSLSAMGLVLALMARTGESVGGLVGSINAMGPTDEVRARGYTILKSKSAISERSQAAPVVERLRSVYEGAEGVGVDLQDGIRIDWPGRGVWAHVRASNTEPIMRVIVEAPGAEAAGAVRDEIDGVIRGDGAGAGARR